MTPQILALVAAVSYALFTLSAWFGLNYSTPQVATLVSLSVRTLVLWAAVLVSGGIPEVASWAVVVFAILGVLQSATSLLTFLGLQKIGASRSQPLRNSYPLWSAMIAITILNETAGFVVVLGTLSIVGGVILISWKSDTPASAYRWWHVLFSLGAGFLAGVAYPLRRYGLSISDEPLFFSAVVAIVSLVCFAPYGHFTASHEPRAWSRRALFPFVAAGFFEAMGALLSLMALSSGRVVVVSPIVATTPLWNLLLAAVFLRGRETIDARTIAGTIAVVGGTVAITVAG
jgi:drug/metabolite transporter, DME family